MFVSSPCTPSTVARAIRPTAGGTDAVASWQDIGCPVWQLATWEATPNSPIKKPRKARPERKGRHQLIGSQRTQRAARPSRLQPVSEWCAAKPISGSRTARLPAPRQARPPRTLAPHGHPTGQGLEPHRTHGGPSGPNRTWRPICPMDMGLLIGQCTCGASPSRAMDRLST